MKWGVEPTATRVASRATTQAASPARASPARAWDDDFEHASQDGEHIAANVTDEMRAEMREYLKTANMSEAGRAVLTKDFQL